MKDNNMNKTIEVKEKCQYSRPEISIVEIDREISLVMMSANPGEDPPEESLGQPGSFSIDPFRIIG